MNFQNVQHDTMLTHEHIRKVHRDTKHHRHNIFTHREVDGL